MEPSASASPEGGQDYFVAMANLYQDRAGVLDGYVESMAIAKPPLHMLRIALMQYRAEYYSQQAEIAMNMLTEQVLA